MEYGYYCAPTWSTIHYNSLRERFLKHESHTLFGSSVRRKTKSNLDVMASLSFRFCCHGLAKLYFPLMGFIAAHIETSRLNDIALIFFGGNVFYNFSLSTSPTITQLRMETKWQKVEHFFSFSPVNGISWELIFDAEIFQYDSVNNIMVSQVQKWSNLSW